ncbi:hypothetical protein MJO28_003811 [Puccinia striiformis f. sp. tritici]|uniref:Uncharacterized protein n=1 Tax=Puccinia striiformis f. sp. tritici TaxID=168172 RepID=A0ACC0EN26_9BASI|nr:hypothetical protein MJO28_003811 [Puccinia striiformis f. sp. tritici]
MALRTPITSEEIVVPLFFHLEAGQLVAKCVKPELFVTGKDNNSLAINIWRGLSFNLSELADIPVCNFHKAYDKITYHNGQLVSTMCNLRMLTKDMMIVPLPNPWRTKANGPCTTNCAGDPVSLMFISHDTLRLACTYSQCHNAFREMQEEGFPVHGCTSGKEVLIVSTVLCFLANSPMHAEITSTPTPANSLHPCRACGLATPARKDKPTMEYVCAFFMINSDGYPLGENRKSVQKQMDSFENAKERDHHHLGNVLHHWACVIPSTGKY